MADDNNKIIVSRIQHRRGLKQDLPQPLRPGEIGFATDSRQVYIGGESNHPNSSQYDAVSFFENTVNAAEITQSLVDNQLIAFTVPGIKYPRGSFDGVSIQRDWQGNTERNIISGIQNPRCVHTSASVPVFSDLVTTPIRTTVVQGSTQTTGAVTIVVENLSGEIPVSRIQVGDLVFLAGSRISVGGITAKNTTGLPSGQLRIIFNIDSLSQVSASTELEIVTASMINMFTTAGRFVNSDVTVHKNGVRLLPEPVSTVFDQPSPVSDFAFDGRDLIMDSANARHRLTLRTPPGPRDEVTLTYYSNANVIQSLVGVNNRVSPRTDFPSFYANKQIPEFLQIPSENIRVSGVTGLGYIALENKHISAYALGTAPVSTPGNLGNTGNLLISRPDSVFTTVDNTATVNNSINRENPTTIEIEFFSGSSVEGFSSNLQIFTVPVTPTQREDFYRYDHLVINSTSSSEFIAGKLYAVHQEHVPQAGISKVTVAVPDIPDVVIARAGQASNTVVEGNTVGIEESDTVSVFYDSGNVVANVISVTANSFEIDQTISESNVTYVNHGTGTPADSFQAIVVGQAASLENSPQVTGLTMFIRSEDSAGAIQGEPASFIRRSNDQDTVFLDSIHSEIDFSVDPETPKFLKLRPNLSQPDGTITLRPVLSVFLATADTLQDVSSVVNENRQIQIPAAGIGVGSPESVEILPAFGIQPGTTDRVFVTQRPGYSSVDVGGVEFELHEDPQTPLLQRLNLVPRKYTRDDTVRAKLEVWLDAFQKDRSTNLFTQVLLGGEKYTSNTVDSLSQYNLVIDQVFGELLFCHRTEAQNFNFLINNLYANNAFAQRSDSLGGVRGLVNLKNNIELQTREAAGAVEKVTTLSNMEVVRFPITDRNRAGDVKFSLDITQFNNFVIEYSIADLGAAPEDSDIYQRTGTMYISARPGLAGSAIITDVFASYIVSDNAQLEPKFDAQLSADGNSVEIVLAQQDPQNFNLAYDIDAELNMRYVVRRWSSFN